MPEWETNRDLRLFKQAASTTALPLPNIARLQLNTKLNSDSIKSLSGFISAYDLSSDFKISQTGRHARTI